MVIGALNRLILLDLICVRHYIGGGLGDATAVGEVP